MIYIDMYIYTYIYIHIYIYCICDSGPPSAKCSWGEKCTFSPLRFDVYNERAFDISAAFETLYLKTVFPCLNQSCCCVLEAPPRRLTLHQSDAWHPRGARSGSGHFFLIGTSPSVCAPVRGELQTGPPRTCRCGASHRGKERDGNKNERAASRDHQTKSAIPSCFFSYLFLFLRLKFLN